MIRRYTLPKMAAVWEDENKFQKWLQIEVLACEAWSKLGQIPAKAVEEIKKKARFDVERIDQIEQEVHHDVIAFLTCVAENVGEASKYIHFGLTSSDVLDAGLALQMRDAADILVADLNGLLKVLKTRAFEFKDTAMIGRTHGIHAEPTTFGLKLALFYFEMERNLERLKRAKEVISYGKISGAVGTYANLDPFIEEYVCQELSLKPAEVSTQILQRDRHAEFLAALAITASSLEKFATEIRNLQRTEILEAEEPFRRGQKGSSAMPHKRNPIICERICGLARLIRANALVAMENVALWHERDISHSSAERVIIPDSAILLDYLLNKFTEVISGLVVYPGRMKENLERTGGLIFSQRVLLKLIEKGMSREEAYRLVQKNAMEVWKDYSHGKASPDSFRERLKKDEELAKALRPKELDELFQTGYFLQHVETIFKRLERKA